MGWLAKIRQQGVSNFLARTFERVVPDWLFRKNHMVFFVMDTKSFPDQNEKPDGDVTVGWADAAQPESPLRKLTYCVPGTSDENLYAVKAEIDAQLAGGFWAAVNFIDELSMGARLELEPNQAWLFGALVSDDFRRRGVYSKILRFICEQLAEKGFDYQVLAVNQSNTPSMGAHQKHALFASGTLTFVRLFSTTWCRTTDRVVADRNWTWNCKKNPILIRFK